MKKITRFVSLIFVLTFVAAGCNKPLPTDSTETNTEGSVSTEQSASEPLPATTSPAAEANNQDKPAPSPSGQANTNTATPASTGGLDGIYSGVTTQFSFQPNFGGFGGGNYVNRLIYLNWVFFADGYVSSTLPLGGQLNGYCVNNPCGTYSVSGSQVTVHFPDQDPKTYNLGSGKTTISLGKDTLRLSKSPTKLNGTWHRSSYTAVGGSGVGGETSITFASDGTFQASNFSGFAGSGGAASTEESDYGNYAIEEYVLGLKHADGSITYHTFFQYGGEDTISIDGVSLITN
jgi:hypothetical protein